MRVTTLFFCFFMVLVGSICVLQHLNLVTTLSLLPQNDSLDSFNGLSSPFSSSFDWREKTSLFANKSFILTSSNESYSYLYSQKLNYNNATTTTTTGSLLRPHHTTRSPPNIVFGVLSHVQNQKQRDAIRSSWGQGINLLFVVAGGRSSSSATASTSSTMLHQRQKQQVVLFEEMTKFHDIVWLERDEDYRSGLVKKTMLLFHFFHLQYPAGNYYLFKTDDDCYVNTTKISSELTKMDPKSGNPIEYYGYPNLHKEPIRDKASKFYVSPQEYKPRQFPPYATGMGYAISKHFASCIDKKLPIIKKQIPWEDVATGILARKCGVSMTFAWSWENYTHWQDDNDGISGGIKFPFQELAKQGKPVGEPITIVHNVNIENMKRIHLLQPLVENTNGSDNTRKGWISLRLDLIILAFVVVFFLIIAAFCTNSNIIFRKQRHKGLHRL